MYEFFYSNYYFNKETHKYIYMFQENYFTELNSYKVKTKSFISLKWRKELKNK